jgi:hypothetical protein
MDEDQSVASNAMIAFTQLTILTPDQFTVDAMEDFLHFCAGQIGDGDSKNALRCWVDFAKSSLEIDPLIEIAIVESIKLIGKLTQEIEMGEAIADRIATMTSCYRLFKTALKYRPEVSVRWKEVLAKMAVRDLALEDPELSFQAAVTAARAGFFDSEFLGIVQNMAVSDDHQIVIAAFRAASVLVSHIECQSEFFVQIMNASYSILTREHPALKIQSGNKERIAEYHTEIMQPMFRFLTRFARFRPSEFPAVDVFAQISNLNGNVSIRETCVSLSCFISFVSHSPNLDFEFVQKLLDFAFSLIPRGRNEFSEPLLLIRVIADIHIQLIEPVIQTLIQFCLELRDGSNLSSLCSLTIVSLLWRLTIGGLFEPGAFLRNMIDFPIIRDEPEFVNCIQSLLQIAVTRPALIVPYCEEIADKFRVILNTPRLKLPDDTRAVIRQFLDVMEL